MIYESATQRVLYGQAVGDALGLPSEFKTKAQVAVSGFVDGRYHIAHRPSLNEYFDPGEWSDDTEQACLLLEAVRDARLNPENAGGIRIILYSNALARKLKTGPTKGIGSLTRKVIAHADFATEPSKAARETWMELGKNASANGAIMRTAVVGTLYPEDRLQTWHMAADFASVTHADPRCRASAVAASCAVAALVRGSGIVTAVNEALLYGGMFQTPEADRTPENQEPLSHWIGRSLDDLRLGEQPYGYTYKTMGAGFWALDQFFSKRREYLDILLDIIREGGDTDTNAAVAGAMLAAAGAEIPSYLIDGLKDKERLDSAAAGVHA